MNLFTYHQMLCTRQSAPWPSPPKRSPGFTFVWKNNVKDSPFIHLGHPRVTVARKFSYDILDNLSLIYFPVCSRFDGFQEFIQDSPYGKFETFKDSLCCWAFTVKIRRRVNVESMWCSRGVKVLIDGCINVCSWLLLNSETWQWYLSAAVWGFQNWLPVAVSV
jgi:hypothetical protein